MKNTKATFIKRFFHDPKQSFFIFGPRGVGKSTLLQEHFNKAIWIDLLDPAILRVYSAHPEKFYDVEKNSSKPKIVVINGIQKVPSILSVIHALIEKHLGIKFVLTGSSARKLRRAGADLLAGRALTRYLHPFMAAELGDQFSLEKALQIGMLPVLLGAQDPQSALQAYVGMYLKEEVQAEGLVRSLESFSRFLEIVSFSHTSVLNITNISRECEVNRKTVEGYIEILEELLLAYKLPIFSKRAQRALSNHPKFYLFDAGVFRALRPTGPLDRVEEIEGAALEGLVVQHLKAWNDYSDEQHDLAFWRTRSGLEVDVVVYGPKEFCAIEIKNSKKVHSHDTKPLQEFIHDYPMAKGILLYRGTERLSRNGILCLPCDEFLRNLRPNKPLWKK